MLKARTPAQEITLKVQRDGRPVTVTVTADGDKNTVAHAGAALLVEVAGRLGLTAALSAVSAIARSSPVSIIRSGLFRSFPRPR